MRMVDIRRVIIIFVIAVLFSVFVFSTISAFYPSPEYDDFCPRDIGLERSRPVERPDNFTCPDPVFSEDDMQQCIDSEGDIQYEYDEYNCQVAWECSYCQKNYNDTREHYNLIKFLISALLGLIGVAVAMFLPESSINEWIGSGLMLGGLFTLFIGTAMSFGDLFRWLRPIVILFELILVIWLAYRKLGD